MMDLLVRAIFYYLMGLIFSVDGDVHDRGATSLVEVALAAGDARRPAGLALQDGDRRSVGSVTTWREADAPRLGRRCRPAERGLGGRSSDNTGVIAVARFRHRGFT